MRTRACPSRHPVLSPDSSDRFINRELSWLDFNHRVVEEAENARHPLLERLRFLSISASNLDEFFSVRVAGLVGQAKAGVAAVSADGRTAGQQLEAIQTRAQAPDGSAAAACGASLRRPVGGGGRPVLCDTDGAGQRGSILAWLGTWFMDRVFPVLTPLAIDPAHPFPFIPNMGLVMVLKLHRDEDGHGMEALIPLPGSDRAVRPPAERDPNRKVIRFLLLEDLVGHVPRPAVPRLQGARPRHVPADPRHRRSSSRRRRRTSCAPTRRR